MSTKPVALVNANIPKLGESISPFFEVRYYDAGELDNKLLNSVKANALISRSTENINDELLAGSSVEYYASATSGSNHVDFHSLKSNNIYYYIAAGCNSNSVAEYVLNSIFLRFGDVLANKTIGIIGLGNIGGKIAKYANEMGLNVLVNDPPKKESGFVFPDYVTHVDLKNLINSSNILTNHVPLINRGDYPTKYLLSSNLLDFSGELIIHASRGGVIKEASLEDILNNGKTKLAIDVWENEPKINEKLLDKAFIATPHTAGHSANGKLNATKMIYNDLIKFFNIGSHKLNLDLPDRVMLDSNNYFSLLQEIDNKRKLKLDSMEFKSIMKKSNQQEADFKKFRRDYEMRFESIK